MAAFEETPATSRASAAIKLNTVNSSATTWENRLDSSNICASCPLDRTPLERVARLERVSSPPGREEAPRSRARAAWTAASRSATPAR